MTMDVIRKNRDNATIMKDWKKEIRAILLSVKTDFSTLID